MHKVIETSISSLSAHRTLTNSQIKMNFFMQEYRVLAFLVACCVCNIPGGHTKSTGILSRGKRQSKEECKRDQYWDSTTATSSCELCLCPAGLRNTATCGDGVGGKVCQDCPNGTFRGAEADYHTCRPCTICDPDANMKTECTRTEDTQCKCKEGFGSIREHCVSCQGHPDAEGCPAELVNTTPAPSTSSESPHGGNDKESKSHQKKDIIGWILFGIVSFICICLVLALCKKKRGIRLPENKKRFSNQETMTDDSTIGSVSPPEDVQSQRSQENAPTPGSASDRETDVNGAAMLQNGSSHSM
eukprot:XP_011676655.1 PREDICTED: tumor necrosis factor receptor superfamily member 14 [Strongylocentrotus purpuratus]